jgi:hypothetical protein
MNDSRGAEPKLVTGTRCCLVGLDEYQDMHDVALRMRLDSVGDAAPRRRQSAACR